MNIVRTFAMAGLLALATTQPAMAKDKLTPLQVQEMQSHEVEASKDIAFSSVMSVLQDSGYRINAADKDTGLVTATASTATKTTWLPFVGFGRSKKTPVVSVYIEQIGASLTKIRLNFVMTKVTANDFGGGADEEPILDASVYRDTFERIDQAVFIRQAASAPAPATPIPAVAAPATPAPATN